MLGKRFTRHNKKEIEQSEVEKKFQNYYDDSSDEDEDKIETTNKEYDVSSSWNGIEKQREEKLHGNEELFSFVAHAAGLKALQLEKIKHLYRALKLKLLRDASETALNQLIRLTKQAIVDSLAQAFAETNLFAEELGLEPKQLISLRKLLNKAEKESKEVIDKFLQKNSEVLIKLLKLQKFYQSTKPLDKLIAFCNEISVEIAIHCKKMMKVKDDKDHGALIQKDLHKLAQERVSRMLTELDFKKLLFSDGKNKAVSRLENYKGQFPLVAKKLGEILPNCQASGSVERMISKHIEETKKQDEVTQVYKKDLRAIRTAKKATAILSASELQTYQSYFSVDNLINELSAHLSSSLKIYLEQALQSFHRPTLAKYHSFLYHDPYEFYAYLKLSNCSQKRQIKNVQHASLFKQNYSVRFWGIAGAPAEVVAYESQEITAVNSARKDRVECLGNYEKIYEDIVQIKQFYTAQGVYLADAQMAGWLREIFQGRLPNLLDVNNNNFHLSEINKTVLLQKLQSITYLLFGCEANRNPAMIVVNQMLLDLIIQKSSWSFEQAFAGKSNGSMEATGKLMPMAPKGAVAVARALESSYKDFMPYHYFYPGAEDNDKKNDNLKMHDLISAEAKIVHEWIALKSSIPTNISRAELAKLALTMIEANFSMWFEGEDKNLDRKMRGLKI